ncbi:ABC transporter ATP-binding protein [Phormidium sp. LEGE 05292]|uniref:heterocyst formation ABC transporter subunit HepA n=1 Tax=[Phormidium] sp. LEGE 05292 TaxID=767427 RepID=UPI0018810A7F|nr:heterocyst formation ABC transporter subunit HepA [Phormidium sp. LEGE 05292]MBE9225214.1 ABC transporter ATP-binding protein [Phormidium sp. LEGE 05292]
MTLQQLRPIRNLLKATKFWQENYVILREFKYLRKIALIALFFTFTAAAFEGFGVGFLLAFLQSLTDPQAKPIQTGIHWVDVWFLGINASSIERLYRVSALILLVTLLRTGFTYLGQIYSEIANHNLADRLRRRLFEQLQSLSLRYFAKTRSGELVNNLTSEVHQICYAFGITSFLITRSSTLIAYLISMLLLSWQLTVISVMLFALLSAAITMLLGRVREASFDWSKASGWYASVALEFINGIRTVQAFATQDFERERFYGASSQLKKAAIKGLAASASVEPLAEGGATAILVGILLLAFATLIPQGQLQPAGLLTFLFVLFRLMPIIRQMNGSRAQISSFQGPLSSIKELLRTDDKPYLIDGKLQFSGLERGIEFVSVDFGYDANNLVLHNVTLTIKKGTTTALVGASGAGKSTLADLIPRFYDPTAGQILIDGIDLREFEINSLRRKLAVVSQDTFIFNTSVRNNIAYGTENADEKAILAAAKLANALEFIQELPEGFDTQLGDRGVRLSGGQRQRIAIARALLRDPEILILDEATSALDSVSERLIQQSLEKLSQGRTVIAIAHRLSTIVRADKVVVLEAGKIVEQGRYNDLLEQRGKLWKYHQMQHELGQVG